MVNLFLKHNKNYDYSKGDNADALNANLNNKLTEIIVETNQEDVNWRIISHAITQIKGAFLLSVLFQR